MRRAISLLLAAILAAQILAVPAQSAEWRSGSDGCSAGISWISRQVFGRGPVWERCCRRHDRPYFFGGSWERRARADDRLQRCIARMGYPVSSLVVSGFVRVFGQPFYPFVWPRNGRLAPAAAWWWYRSGPE